MSDILDELWAAEDERKRNSIKKYEPLLLEENKEGHVVDNSKARYKIHTNRYCSLSKNKDFRTWLKDITPDLHSNLVEFIQNSKSCKKNSQKMKELQSKLQQRGLLKELVYFLLENFPNIVSKQN